MFYLPHFVWSTLNELSGLKIQSIMIWASKAVNADTEVREKDLAKLAIFIKQSIKVETDAAHTGAVIRRLSRLFGSYVTCLYVTIKALYVINVISQFFVLNAFLGTPYDLWGYNILLDIMAGRNWNQTGHFPRVTMCDFSVREVGNTQHFSVQCVLMINLFNEKIFIFVWFWLVFVSIVTCLNFLYWLFNSAVGSADERLINRYLITSGDVAVKPRTSQSVTQFTRSFLRSDGVLILKFISANIGDMVATQLVEQLWHNYSALHCPHDSATVLPSKSSGEEDGSVLTSVGTGLKYDAEFDPGLSSNGLVKRNVAVPEAESLLPPFA